MTPIEEYLELDGELTHVRWTHLGKRSAEEDALLARMDAVWSRLTREERSQIHALPLPAPTTADDAEFVDIDPALGRGVRERVTKGDK